MRVLHAFKVYKPHHGGIVSTIDQLAHAWPDIDSRVLACISAAGLAETIEDDGVPVRKAGSFGHLMSMPVSPSFPFMFWREARRANVIAYHYPFPLVDLAVTLRFPSRAGLVIHWHSEIVSQRLFARMLQPFIERCLRRADRIIVSTPAHIEISPLLERYRDKCEVVPFGVNPQEWRDDSVARTRAELFLLAAGRLVPYKGFDVLLRALAKTNAHLTLVGEGSEESRLRALANELGLSDRVRFAGGVDRHELRRLLNACCAFVLPSVSPSETFGIVQLEAMSCGKPIINTDAHPGIGWVARDGKEAITVPAGDVHGLADALNRIWRDERLAHELGANGMQRVMSEFTQARFFARVREIYERAGQRQ